MADGSTSLLHLVHRVSQIGNERFAEALPGEVTSRQLFVLRALGADPGTSQTAVVEATGIDRSTMSEILKRLISRKLVKRRRAQKDARAYVVQLTDEGSAVLAAALPVLEQIETSLLDAMPSKDREQFIASLHFILNDVAAADKNNQPSGIVS